MLGTHDVDLSIGADSSPAAAGLAELRNLGQQAYRDLSSTFAQSLAIGGLIGAANSWIEKAHEIHHEAERFAIDAEELQLVTNAGKAAGISMGQTARALNLLQINAQAALDPTSKQAQALAILGIEAENFARLNAAEKFFALADAYKNSAKDGEAYAAAATLIGKRNTEMIPLLVKGSEALREQSKEMQILGDRTVETGDKIYVALQKLKNVLFVDVGGPIMIGLYRVVAAITDIGAAAGAAYHNVAALLTFDWKTAQAEGQKFVDILKGGGPGLQMVRDLDSPKKKEKTSPVYNDFDSDTSEAGAARAGHGSAAAEARTQENLMDKLAEKERRNRLETMGVDEKIVAIQKERNDLQDELYRLQINGNLSDEQAAEIQTQILDKDHELADVQDKAAKAQDEYNNAVFEARQAAEDQALTAERQNELLQLSISGHDDVANLLQKEWEIQDAIDDAIDAANEAWSEGNQELALQNEALAGLLEKQKELTQLADQTARARESAANADDFQSAGTFETTRFAAVLATAGAGEYADAIAKTGKPPGKPSDAIYAQAFKELAEWQTRRNVEMLREQSDAAFRSVPEQIAFLQKVIPQIQAQVNPNESYQLVQFLQQMIDGFSRQLKELQDMNVSLQPEVGGHG